MRVGGRPWTYIWRDIYHEAEWLMQIIWLLIGAVVGIYFGWTGLGLFIGIYTLGYINGHFHWGTKWIKGQKGVR
ncbi:hypothetical protein ES703_28416 [subsurface metagenome]